MLERLNLLISAPEGFEIVGDIPRSYMNDESCLMVRYDIRRIDDIGAQQNPMQDLIAQDEADKKAYPLTWYKAWKYKSGLIWMPFTSNDTVKDDGYECRRHPQATHIMQSEQDKINYPEFWHELTQWSNLNEDKWRGVPFDSDTLYEFNKYRQHPHRENIIKFHACSEDDKKRWQILDQVRGWITPCSQSGFPNWHEDCENYHPTTNAEQCMEIQECEKINIRFSDKFKCWQAFCGKVNTVSVNTAKRAIIACFVKSKLGEEVDCE